MIRRFSKALTGVKDYLCDKQQGRNRIIQIAKLSALANAAIALGKIGMGIYSLSFFLCVNGIYSIGISLAKAVAIKAYKDKKAKSGLLNEYRCYYLVGIIILLTSLAYMIYCIKMLIGEHSNIHYTGLMVVAIGSFTAIEFVLSVQGIISARRDRDIILEAIKRINLASSLIALVLTQTAILSYESRGDNIYLQAVGIFVGGISATTGLYMMIHIKRRSAAMDEITDPREARAIADLTKK